jgi:predicted methyltransferase
MNRRGFLTRLAALASLAVIVYVVWQAALTLARLEQVEQERDTWQRPRDIITALNLHSGEIVVDLGSGSGYFSMRLAPVVGPTGRVIAVDVLREPLAFLSIRRFLRRDWQIDVVRGRESDPRLTSAHVDAVLVVNTYHELVQPGATVTALQRALKAGGRLVVCDRRPRDGPGPSPQAERANHTLSPNAAEAEITGAGFTLLHRDDAFIDRPGDQPWWLMVFTRR